MSRSLESTWKLTDTPLSQEDFVKAFQDFEFFMSHCQQIINKRRQLVPMTLNAYQKEVFKILLPMIDPATRENRARSVILLKGRRVGATTGLIAFINYMLSFTEGIENLNVLHLFPVSDAATKIYSSKVKDIITGVHPDMMPTISKVSGISSIVLNYESILQVERHNSYEIASAGTSSLRGSDFHMAILDEYADYKKPYEVEAVVEPMMPEDGFSLSIFASTFKDGVSLAYREKILQARAHPDEWDIIFVPWFVSYPEYPTDVPLESLELTEYDQNVIIPAMIEYDFPRERWGASIKWYHQKSAKMSSANMHREFPTTIDEILALGQNKSCFTPKSLDKQEGNIMPNKAYRLVTDAITNKSELHADEDGPFMIYRPPISGHRYLLCCDPIGSNSGESDYFAAGMFDLERNSEVATLYIRDLPVEDLAELTAGLAQIYNRAMILPESNFGQALVACIRARGYYNFYYTDKRAKANKEPGIRTSVSTKPKMIDKLQLMLDGGRITIYSEETLRQLRKYEKIVKDRSDGGSSVSFSAPRGDHDDMIIPLLLFAGSRSDRELSGKKGQGFAIL